MVSWWRQEEKGHGSPTSNPYHLSLVLVKPLDQRQSKRCAQVRETSGDGAYDGDVRIIGELGKLGIIVLEDSK
jgi:hypothetical protein